MNKKIFVLIFAVIVLSGLGFSATDKSLTIIKQGSIDFYLNHTWINDWNFQLMYSEIYKPITFFTIEPIAIPPFNHNVTGIISCNGGANILNVNYDPNINSVFHFEDFMLNESADINNLSVGGKIYEWNCEFNPSGYYDWYFNYQIGAYATLVDTTQLETEPSFFDKLSDSYKETFSQFTLLFTYITNFVGIVYLLFEFFVLSFVVFGLIPFMFYLGVKHLRKLNAEK